MRTNSRNDKKGRMDHMLDTLQMILAWGIILTIAVMYFKPIVMCFLLMRKNNAGLATSKELSEIADLLQQHPWREEQELQMNGTETEAPLPSAKRFLYSSLCACKRWSSYL